ncbi:MAG: LCP family protein [Eubacteriales bacterium]
MSTVKKGNNTTQSKKASMSPEMRAKKRKKRIILFGIEIVLLLGVIGVLYVVTKTENIQSYAIAEEDIIVNEAVKESESLQGYRNIALFGVDSRTGVLGKGTLSDTIMVASINEDTHEVKLVSIYRDTYLNIGTDEYNKANSAYSKGGPQQAINMLNMNLDLNITDYVTVGFTGVIETVDMLGGIMIDIDESEIGYLNDYQYSMAEELGRSYTALTESGYQLVDGMQAMAYCRIRYTSGDDFKRTERQREVLVAISEKAKTANASTLNSIANEVFGHVATSLSLEEIVALASIVAEYTIVDTTGFPSEDERVVGTIGVGSSIVPDTLEDNVVWLHEFLFDEVDYEVSDDILTYSNQIESDTSKYFQ